MGIKDTISNLIFGKDDDPGFEVPEETYDDFDALNDNPEPEPDYRDNGNIKVSSGASIEMVVVKPEKLGTVTQIADYLVDRKTILLNLEETNKDTARRLIDFLNGVAYAINGDLRKVAANTYVITPSNVELSGEKLSSASESEFSKE